MASEAQQISQTSASVADQKITRRHWWTVVTVSMLVSTAAVLIGTYKFQLGPAPVVLFPIIWAVVIGGIIGTQRIRRVSGASRAVATLLLEIGIILFLARLGTQIGPSLAKVTEIGPAILLQEVGHIFGTVILALPIAVAMGLGRVAIGATWSIDRESFLAFAIQRFGVRSGEYRGVFSVWLLGSLFGAVFISLLAGFLGGLNIFDPRALALGLGLGSASMMLGGVGALSLLYPEQAGEIMALAALSNLVTNIVGFYAGVFLSLPLCRRLYAFWSRLFGKDDEGRSTRGTRGKTAQSAAAQLAPPVAVEVDPALKLTPRITILAFAIAGASALAMNVIGTKSFAWNDLAGVVVLLLLTGLSFRLARLMPSVPSSVWVLTLTTVLSAPFLPTAGLLAALTGHLDVILIGLPALTLIGLTVGRDIKALKSLSWKIIVVALVTYSASFIAAAALGQIALGR
ncbi:DUF3100 domain-containing protein [Arthrobacter sp. AL08]|uniref:DUF3100 domain-containing protein n=1 Tax=Micrococcaceae TaxID=1268 RepID=UPI00249ADFF5|nr:MULTISPECIES: DUF3100 domain-containing protein [Micrococcaceae]MDI3243076.1 DUF3100 domain-containing protein [Arthrobacter sp. AL05]MDI3279110.1 DUF3100 domain-containing protein [Arthrobacter sp. AL08]MDJ0353940.1 DUF3100 domain-containing protein [Pseudarthrobacter sp. PH31-O2]